MNMCRWCSRQATEIVTAGSVRAPRQVTVYDCDSDACRDRTHQFVRQYECRRATMIEQVRSRRSPRKPQPGPDLLDLLPEGKYR